MRVAPERTAAGKAGAFSGSFEGRAKGARKKNSAKKQRIETYEINYKIQPPRSS